MPSSSGPRWRNPASSRLLSIAPSSRIPTNPPIPHIIVSHEELIPRQPTLNVYCLKPEEPSLLQCNEAGIRICRSPVVELVRWLPSISAERQAQVRATSD